MHCEAFYYKKAGLVSHMKRHKKYGIHWRSTVKAVPRSLQNREAIVTVQSSTTVSQQEVNSQQEVSSQQEVKSQQEVTSQQEITLQQAVILQQEVNSQQEGNSQQEVSPQHEVNSQQEINSQQEVNLQQKVNSPPSEALIKQHVFDLQFANTNINSFPSDKQGEASSAIGQVDNYNQYMSVGQIDDKQNVCGQLQNCNPYMMIGGTSNRDVLTQVTVPMYFNPHYSVPHYSAVDLSAQMERLYSDNPYYPSLMNNRSSNDSTKN